MSRVLVQVWLLSLAFVPLVKGTPIAVPVNQSQSSITVTLCVAGPCDTDTSPVAGESWIKLDSYSSPTTLTVYDFNYSLTQNLNFYLSWGIFGHLTATGSNLVLDYATPFVPQAPAAVTGNAFAVVGVPSNMTGTVAYSATGLACTALQGAGYPCADTINLADQGTQTGDMSGTITISPTRVVTLVSQPNVSGPLDPTNPSLGTLSAAGTITGQVTVPLRGDANLDGTLDGRDIQAFLQILLNPSACTWQQQFTVDMNDDDVFDTADVTLFVDCLLNGGC